MNPTERWTIDCKPNDLIDSDHYQHGLNENKSATIRRVEAKPKSKI
jgi:hypothetical protein